MKKHATAIKRLTTLFASTALFGLSACNVQAPEGEIQGAAGLAIAAERAISGLERKVLQIDGFVVPYLQGVLADGIGVQASFAVQVIERWQRAPGHPLVEELQQAVEDVCRQLGERE